MALGPRSQVPRRQRKQSGGSHDEDDSAGARFSCVSWLFSQALAAEYLAATFSGGGRFAQLSVMPTARRFWRNGKPMDACRFSQFGLTLQLLTADCGVGWLRWFREDFLARTSVSPEPETVSMASAPASGERWHESFARWDPDSCTWRTPQRSLLGGFTEFSETWPACSSMWSGECSARPTLERPTCASESGFWPTPVTLDSGSRFNCSMSDGAQLRPTLGAMARYNLWPTPTVKGNYNRRGSSPKSGDGLATAVWRLPTPTVAMRKGSSIGALRRKDGRSRANDRLDYRIEGSGLSGRLNPAWVEWLMGWPIGWTALPPLAMGRFREWLQQHGGSSLSDSVDDADCGSHG